MASLLMMQGRVVAATYAEAVDKTLDKLKSQGYEPAGKVRPYPCLVQPWKEAVWWEYQVRVKPSAGNASQTRRNGPDSGDNGGGNRNIPASQSRPIIACPETEGGDTACRHSISAPAGRPAWSASGGPGNGS